MGKSPFNKGGNRGISPFTSYFSLIQTRIGRTADAGLEVVPFFVRVFQRILK